MFTTGKGYSIKVALIGMASIVNDLRLDLNHSSISPPSFHTTSGLAARNVQAVFTKIN
jgi:hypothetical protein